MALLSRRSMIKGITALSLGAICEEGRTVARSIGKDDDLKVELNVVLHGLFVINLLDTHIQLLTPYVPEHIYKVGSWSFPTVETLRGGETYKLSGVGQNRAPEINHHCGIVLSQSEAHFQVQPEESYLVVEIPLPKEIRFLRCLMGTNLFEGPSKDLLHTDGISLCPVLIYDAPNSERLALSGSGWKPLVQEGTRSANLHFWAEPPEDLDPLHASRAYARLMDLIPPLQFSLTTDAKPPVDLVTGVRGLPSVEELGWSEWASPGEGTRPVNCSSIVVTK